MLESSFRKIQRVIAKSPLWRSFPDIDKLMHALESRGIHLFQTLPHLNPTGRFLLVSMLRDKKEVIINDNEEEEEEEDNMSSTTTTILENNQDEKDDENENEKEKDDDNEQEVKKEEEPKKVKQIEEPLWADLDVIVKDSGNNTINLGIYLSDWNDIVVGISLFYIHVFTYYCSNYICK